MKKQNIALILCGLVAASAFAVKSADNYSFIRIAKEGTEVVSEFTAEMDIMGMAIKVSGTGIERVVKVTKDGYVSESRSKDVVVVTPQGEERQEDDPEPLVLTVSAKGVTTKRETKQEDGDSLAIMDTLLTLVAPDKPVTVGESWKSTFKAPTKEAQSVSSSYKVVGEEKVGAWTCVKVSLEGSVAVESETCKVNGDIWVNKEDFSMVKADVKFSNLVMEGMPGAFDMHMTSMRKK